MSIKRLQKLAGLLREDENDFDLSDTPEFKPKIIKSEDIPDGWEEVEGDPEEDGYLLFFRLETGVYEPLSGLGNVFVSISNSPSGPGFEVDVRHNENPPSTHFFKTFQEAWIFARSEMIDIRADIDEED